MIRIASITLILALIAGCSLRMPSVYKMNVPQGNIVKQDMLDQLKPGLTKRQVRFIMGSPMVADSFNDQRWDYVFFVKHGDSTFREEHIVINFENDKLKDVVGELNFTVKQGKETSAEDIAPTAAQN